MKFCRLPARHARHAVSLVAAMTGILSGAQAADLGRPSSASPILTQLPAVTGFYFGTRNGFGSASDTRFNSGGGAVNVKNQYDLGTVNGVIAGYNFGPMIRGIGLRAELEVARGQFSIDTHTVGGVKQASSDSFGEMRGFTGFANAFLYFNLGYMTGASSDSFLNRITPFLGGGLGFGQVELRKMGISATGALLKDSDTRFGYNLSAGVGVEVFAKTTLEFGYRFIAVPELQFTARDGTRTQTELKANLFTVGMRRQF